jgi:hypothetical protein
MFTDVSEVLAASIIRVITLIMETANTYETLVNFYQTSWHNNTQDSHPSAAMSTSNRTTKLISHFTVQRRVWKFVQSNLKLKYLTL